jgi:hypothetical protein
MKSITELNLHKVTGPNGEEVYPENSAEYLPDGTFTWIVTGHWVQPLNGYERPESFGGTFSKEDATRIASEIGGTCAPLNTDQLKSLVYSDISDTSKEWCGCRRRLDVAYYTLEELEEILQGYYQMIDHEREEEERIKHEEKLAAMLRRHKRKDERRKFDSGSNKMKNAFNRV